MKYMLDTNICIYIINKKPRSVLQKKFNKIHLGDIGISSITYSELCYGVEKSQHTAQNELALLEFVAPLIINPFDDKAGHCYGEIRANLEKKGNTIGALDMLIAAHAKSLNCTLVTNNTKEFSKIPKLKLQDWVSQD